MNDVSGLRRRDACAHRLSRKVDRNISIYNAVFYRAAFYRLNGNDFLSAYVISCARARACLYIRASECICVRVQKHMCVGVYVRARVSACKG